MSENMRHIDNPSNMPTQKERFLNDAESLLNYNIQKVEADLKESIQKVEADLKESIQKVEADLKESIQKVEADLKKSIQKIEGNHQRLVNRLWWVAGTIFAGAIAIAVALISRGS